jgi:hypothetical protein
MAKKFIDGESKEQRKVRKAQDKLEKQNQTRETDDSVSRLSDVQYTILCLKHGDKYSADYVNKLYNMCKRNCTLNFEFVCLTENHQGIDKDIRILPLSNNLQGWWCKPYMFNKDLLLSGTILYMDLDVVIAGNIDKLFTYAPGHWCTVRDFTRAMRPKWYKYNSSIIRFQAGTLDYVWQDYKQDPVKIQKKYFGDQDYLYDITINKRASLYPDSWILSWKWEVRKDKQFAPGGLKGNRKLKTIENVTPRVECCVTVFHGDPNPHNCEDPWVVDNWK